MFWLKPKIQYTDIIQEYRAIVLPWWFTTMDKILYRSHWQHGEKKGWKKAIIYWAWECEEWRKWYRILRHKLDNKNEIESTIICYDPGDTDKYYDDVKKDYWEFQEEFEAIEEAKKEMEKVERLSKELEEARKKSEILYLKWKRILKENTINQFWIWKSNE